MSTKPTTMSFRAIPAVLFTSALFWACGTSSGPSTDAVVDGVQRTEKEVTITSGEPVTMADLSIEGMSCEMMCGGSIKKALAGLGVTNTEIKMNESEGPDHAIVTYDAAKVSDAQMIEAIQELYDGQYKVVAVTVTKEVKGASASNTGDEERKGEGAVSVSIPKQVVVPSIVALLTRILR